MWVLMLATIGLVALVLLGVLALVMVLLHRKPRGVSSRDVGRAHADSEVWE